MGGLASKAVVGDDVPRAFAKNILQNAAVISLELDRQRADRRDDTSLQSPTSIFGTKGEKNNLLRLNLGRRCAKPFQEFIRAREDVARNKWDYACVNVFQYRPGLPRIADVSDVARTKARLRAVKPSEEGLVVEPAIDVEK
jgi:hypothetical protein